MFNLEGGRGGGGGLKSWGVDGGRDGGGVECAENVFHQRLWASSYFHVFANSDEGDWGAADKRQG